MKNWLKIDISAFGFSLLVHVGILVVLWLIRLQVTGNAPDVAIESIMDEERVQQEFSQEMEIDTTVSEMNNMVAGGTVSNALGSPSNMSAPKQNIEISEKLRNPQIKVRPGNISAPGDSMLDENLGELQIAGETGAVVEGYGAAMSQMTHELLRLMRDNKILVIWLFDESESMKDDQKEIALKFDKVYTELGIAQEKGLVKPKGPGGKSKSTTKKRSRSSSSKTRTSDAHLLTSVIGYGENVHLLTPKPTANISEIRGAINKIGIDRTGKENMCSVILKSIEQYRPIATRQKRKMVFVVVTDESGTDGQAIEQVVDQTRRFNTPVYIMGREAIFGYKFARIVWKDPQYGLNHFLYIDRGPETAFPECMQWDGLRARYDSHSSGFGPYEQVRLARESGGIFFVLPGSEKQLVGRGANDKRKFDFLDMKEYQPLLLPRRVYEEERNKSKNFRSKIWDVIVTLNPNKNSGLPKYDSNLNVRVWHYPGELPEFRKTASKEVLKAARSMELLNIATGILEKAEPFRAREDSQRWRASFDLLRAQCFAYRVRLFQFLLAMDNHANDFPPFKNPKNNGWTVHRTPTLIKPDEDQYDRLKRAFKLKVTREVYLQQMDDLMKVATSKFRFVIAEHPGTPWARRASLEMRQGFGMRFGEDFYDPRYKQGLNIKIPKF